MEEKNSEKKATWVVILMAIVSALAAVADQLLGAGVFDQWPTVAAIATPLLAAAAATGVYTSSRPKKHAAMAQREAVGKTEAGK